MNQYSHFRQKRQLSLALEKNYNTNQSLPRLSQSPWAWLNLSLLGLVVIFLFTYIFQVNQIIARRYSVEVLKKQMDQAKVKLDVRNSSLDKEVNLEALLSFAQKNGMVEAHDTDSIFLTKNSTALK